MEARQRSRNANSPAPFMPTDLTALKAFTGEWSGETNKIYDSFFGQMGCKSKVFEPPHYDGRLAKQP